MANNKNNKPNKPPKSDKIEPSEKTDKKILAFVERCENAGDLESLVRNATKLGNRPVAEAAFRKRISLVPAERPGTLEHDFWQTVQALEFGLSEERAQQSWRGVESSRSSPLTTSPTPWAPSSTTTARL